MELIYLKWGVIILYKPTQEDIELLFQGYIETKIKIELLDVNFKTIDTLQDALISDNYSVDADSDIRRTYEGTFYCKDPSFFIGKDRKIWTDKYIRVWKGKKNNKTGQIVWYNIGVYLFNDTSYTYNESTKHLTISCVDLISKLNNTFSGQITGAVTFQIPCEQVITKDIIKHSEVKTISENGSTVANTRVSIGTNFKFSLKSPHTNLSKHYKLASIEIGIAGVHIFDADWNIITSDDVKLKLSIDNSIQSRELDKYNKALFLIDKSKLDSYVLVGFLQNISFTNIIIYFNYIETQADFQTYISNFCETVYWNFCDTNNQKSCLPVNKLIGETITEKLTLTQSIEGRYPGTSYNNSLTIDTTERALTDTITQPISWYTTVTDAIKKLGRIDNYTVECTDFVIPYDLEFSTGTSIYDILKELVNLMINWEIFFDTNGVLHIQPIPTLYEDEILLSGEQLKSLIISETNKDSFSNIRNITEVWGMSLDAAYYTDKCKKTSTGYNIIFDDLIFTDEKKISNNTILAVKIDEPNIRNPQITITYYSGKPRI